MLQVFSCKMLKMLYLFFPIRQYKNTQFSKTAAIKLFRLDPQKVIFMIESSGGVGPLFLWIDADAV